MIEYHNNILCVQINGLCQSGIITLANYKKLCQRGYIKVARRACLNKPALVVYDSLPERFRQAYESLFGDPHKAKADRFFIEQIKHDGEAKAFFTGYKCPDNRFLPDATVSEYYNNAIILNTIRSILISRKAEIKGMGNRFNINKFWEKITTDVLRLNKLEYPHGLPSNSRRLRERYSRYDKEGYRSLIHKNFCNQNSRKVTADVERLILAIYCQSNNPYAKWVCEDYNRFMGHAVEVVDMETGELFNPADFIDTKTGKPIAVSEPTVWRYINKPGNRAVIEAMRSNHHRFNSTQRPHHHRHAPLYSLSKISMDDRDLPRRLADGSRVKAYYAYDVASGCLIGTAYSRKKDSGLFIDCVRNMFRFIHLNGWGMPMEVEVEHHIVGLFKNDLMNAGTVFPFVRWCAPGNSQEKEAEYLNRVKKYGYEKRYQDGIGRFYARLEANVTDGERVYDEQQNKYVIRERTYTFEQLVADDLEMIERYNNDYHGNQERYRGKTRMQVLRENMNPNLSDIDPARLIRYIGDCTETTIQRNQYVQVRYNKYQLPDPKILNRLAANNYTVKAYYLPEDDGGIGNVFLYQNDVYLCVCDKIVPYNSSTAERTEADEEAMADQSKYIARFDKMVKEGKRNLPKTKIIEKKKDYNSLKPVTLEIVPDTDTCRDASGFDGLLKDYDPEYWAEMAMDQL